MYTKSKCPPIRRDNSEMKGKVFAFILTVIFVIKNLVLNIDEARKWELRGKTRLENKFNQKKIC